MRSFLSLAPLVGLTYAYDAHTTHATLIDQTNSTKSVGLVQWQHFFDIYVLATTVVEPSGYVADDFLCWFQICVETWHAADTRYALTAL